MSSSTSQAGRPPSKRRGIVREVTRRIIRGEWGPGEQIPTQVELEEMFDAGNPTVQKALNRLADSGFIVARRPHGTYVTENPPHTCRYGLVFPTNPHTSWSRLYAALVSAAEELEGDPERAALRVPVYFDVDRHMDSEDCRRLMEDVRNWRLGGVIFAFFPYELADTPLLGGEGPPCVAVAEAGAWEEYSIPARYPDRRSLVRKALDYVGSGQAGERNRVAMLTYDASGDFADFVVGAAAQRGLKSRRSWVQSPRLKREAVERTVELLCGRPAETRPDALIIEDDNYVEDGTRALAEMGVRVPEDLLVVGHCNFPNIPPASVPVVRIGFRARDLLLECIETLRRLRAADNVEGVKMMPAVFDRPPR
jgi:DNA-binding transcriptional regulator YhcF (GntR family)